MVSFHFQRSMNGEAMNGAPVMEILTSTPKRSPCIITVLYVVIAIGALSSKSSSPS